MSLKLKALLHMLTMMGVSVLIAGTLTLLLAYFPTDLVLGGLGLCVSIYMFVLLYQITLSRLESEERLKEISKG
jgi:hypothetical protein